MEILDCLDSRSGNISLGSRRGRIGKSQYSNSKSKWGNGVRTCVGLYRLLFIRQIMYYNDLQYADLRVLCRIRAEWSGYRADVDSNRRCSNGGNFYLTGLTLGAVRLECTYHSSDYTLVARPFWLQIAMSRHPGWSSKKGAIFPQRTSKIWTLIVGAELQIKGHNPLQCSYSTFSSHGGGRSGKYGNCLRILRDFEVNLVVLGNCNLIQIIFVLPKINVL